MLNIWKRFSTLIRPAPQEIMTVKQIVGNGTVVAETVSGGMVRLKCGINVNIDDKVLTQTGEVKSKTENLPYYEVEV